MVLLIAGASHTGKTMFAQKLLEKYHIPYVSIDHLKMGLIRSGEIPLTPENDSELCLALWSILREMIKTVIENRQNLIIEGGYIPFDWKKDFDAHDLSAIQYVCLVMSSSYIKRNFSDIKKYACVIENRKDDSACTLPALLEENLENLRLCQKYGNRYILIDQDYQSDLTFDALF